VPHESFDDGHTGDEFISKCTDGAHYKYKGPYWAPYRTLYSRNISNLFMAGRDISVDREALGAVRVMRTCGMMGEVVGKAAAICVQQDTTPRGVYAQHLERLKELMRDRVTRRPRREPGRVPLALARRRMGAEREPAHLDHAEFALRVGPRLDRFYRVARTSVVWALCFKKRKNVFSLHRGQQGKAPMIAGVARQRLIRGGRFCLRTFHRRSPRCACALRKRVCRRSKRLTCARRVAPSMVACLARWMGGRAQRPWAKL
jgi:hypothetical protein